MVVAALGMPHGTFVKERPWQITEDPLVEHCESDVNRQAKIHKK